MNDPALLMSLAAILLSVLSPLLTALINNHYHLKFKNMDFYETRRAGAIESYIHAAGAYIQNASIENAQAYGIAYGDIFLFAPSSLWPEIEALNKELIGPRNPILFHSHFTKICQSLSPEYPRIKDRTYKRAKARNHKKDK